MSIDGSERILTLSTCSGCKGSGTLECGTNAGIKCTDCEGTGQKIITMSELTNYLDKQLVKTIMRSGILSS